MHAFDYLLKPIGRELLYPILDRLLAKEQSQQEYQQQAFLPVKCGQTLLRIPFSGISHVEVMNKHLYFNMTDGQVREVFGSLREYEPLLLARPEFMRVHRSYIVNMLQAAELSAGGIVTFSGNKLPVSRILYPQLQQDYMKLLFGQRGG